MWRLLNRFTSSLAFYGFLPPVIHRCALGNNGCFLLWCERGRRSWSKVRCKKLFDQSQNQPPVFEVLALLNPLSYSGSDHTR